MGASGLPVFSGDGIVMFTFVCVTNAKNSLFASRPIQIAMSICPLSVVHCTTIFPVSFLYVASNEVAG